MRFRLHFLREKTHRRGLDTYLPNGKIPISIRTNNSLSSVITLKVINVVCNTSRKVETRIVGLDLRTIVEVGNANRLLVGLGLFIPTSIWMVYSVVFPRKSILTCNLNNEAVVGEETARSIDNAFV